MKLKNLNPPPAPTNDKIKSKAQLKEALKRAGKLDRWDVASLSPQDIENSFKRSRGEIFREACKNTLLGARNIGKKSALAGAFLGGSFGIAGGILAGIGFPPSILAVGITIAVNAALGATLGGIAGAVFGGLFNGAKTALSLILTSPRQRLMKHARLGRKELNKLEKQEMTQQLSKKKMKRLDYLREHVPLWEYAANNLGTSEVDRTVEELISFDRNKEITESLGHTAMAMPEPGEYVAVDLHPVPLGND